mmetsp:Transcript_89121/g.252674  ORF Transcript_89121/g.252674 Transcript_89121/m.252674 type:complete len:318 (-) Transcript_89121:23-976(-)
MLPTCFRTSAHCFTTGSTSGTSSWPWVWNARGFALRISVSCCCEPTAPPRAASSSMVMVARTWLPMAICALTSLGQPLSWIACAMALARMTPSELLFLGQVMRHRWGVSLMIRAMAAASRCPPSVSSALCTRKSKLRRDRIRSRRCCGGRSLASEGTIFTIPWSSFSSTPLPLVSMSAMTPYSVSLLPHAIARCMESSVGSTCFLLSALPAWPSIVMSISGYSRSTSDTFFSTSTAWAESAAWLFSKSIRFWRILSISLSFSLTFSSWESAASVCRGLNWMAGFTRAGNGGMFLHTKQLMPSKCTSSGKKQRWPPTN